MLKLIKYFFLPPCDVEALPVELQQSGERPILHLLRRDLEKIYDKEGIYHTCKPIKHGPPMLVCAGILMGIDMLSRFFVAECKRAKKRKRIPDGERFKIYLTRIGGLPRKEANFLWAFRCALSHSYGLVLRTRSSKKTGVILTTDNKMSHWLVENNKGKIKHFTINMWGLKKLFFDLIQKAKSVLNNNKRTLIRKRFRDHYNSHGFIVVLK